MKKNVSSISELSLRIAVKIKIECTMYNNTLKKKVFINIVFFALKTESSLKISIHNYKTALKKMYDNM